MSCLNKYTDLKGREWDVTALDTEERAMLEQLRDRAASHPDWNDFETFAVQAVGQFYDARGIERAESIRKPLFKIAQDLTGRIAVAAGLARLPSDCAPPAVNKAS